MHMHMYTHCICTFICTYHNGYSCFEQHYFWWFLISHIIVCFIDWEIIPVMSIYSFLFCFYFVVFIKHWYGRISLCFIYFFVTWFSSFKFCFPFFRKWLSKIYICLNIGVESYNKIRILLLHRSGHPDEGTRAT